MPSLQLARRSQVVAGALRYLLSNSFAQVLNAAYSAGAQHSHGFALMR
jgi:hypothetical protein